MYFFHIKASTRKILFSLVFFIFIIPSFQKALGQLSASFSISRESGCRPLTVKFVNTTTGAGQDVTYSWNFGNGNTSTLKDPGATFIDEMTYTVTLTVTSGGNTSTATRQVIVHKTPKVDFSATPTSGCMPLEVSFQANVTPGDGTIDRYFWDYGDGKTEEAPTLSAPKHTYTQAQQAPVSLTVTNSFGCFNTKTYSGLVTVFEEVLVDFTADKPTVCKVGDAVKFSDKSKGGTLTKYEWDFGDGNTSNQKNPTHIYNKEGVFDVSLKVTNSNGCSSKQIFEKYIRVGAFGQKINYNKESVKCTEGSTTFYAVYDGDGFDYKVKWFVNNQPVSGYQEHTYELLHTQPGSYDVRAEYDFSGCKVNASTAIEVFPKPPLKGMVIERNGTCSAPFNFVFSDTTPGATKWSWVFWHISVPEEKRNQKSFTHTFPFESDISPTVFLNVENEFGCMAQDVKSFSLVNTKVRVETTKTYYNDSFRCKERIYSFKGEIWSSSNDSFILDSLEWNFGDTIIRGTTEPVYQFKNGEDKKIFFRYKTKNGCSGTVEKLMQLFKIVDSLDFQILPGKEICGNNLVQLIPKGVAKEYVQFLDNNWQPIPLAKDLRGITINYYQFNTGGENIIHMIFNRMSQGYCIDTASKKILVKHPFSGIGQVLQPCDGDRGLVRIVDTSRGATFWEWNFGDGTKKTFTSKPDTVEHHYKANGTYKVYQKVKFEDCEVTDSVEVKVFLKQKPVISILGDSVCEHSFTHPFRVTIADSSSATEHFARNYYSFYEVLHYPGGYSRGGLGFAGGYRNGFMADMYPDSAGFTSLKVVLRGYYCSDTSDLIPFKIKGPSAHFGVQEHWKCFNDTIQFLDASSGNLNVPIIKWEWDFGNGTKTTKNAGGNFGFRYDAPGFYYPYLKVTDADGCHAETRGYLYSGGDLWLEGPKAVIGTVSSTIPLNTIVDFKNNSFGKYTWSDGNYTWFMPDGSMVSAFEPEGYLFDKEGEFDIKLVATNPYFDCVDSTTIKIKVVTVNAQFTHSISYVNNNGCPPAHVTFTSTATNAVRYSWNFGNGATAGNQTNVSHTYNQPGVYTVWHYTWDQNNNVDSTFDIIEIEGPYALISANRMFSCNDLDVTLSADVKNATSFTWDFGDGTLSSTAATTLNHRYLTAGIYTPSLVLEDDEGCQATSQLAQPLIVDSLTADFSYLPTGICAGGQVQFASASRSFSSTRLGTPMQYQWSINGNPLTPGSDSTLAHAFAGEGSYAVRLQVQTAFGCSAGATKTLTVQPPLQAAAAGPTSLCIGDSATFTASSVGANVQYRWYLPGRNVITGNNTPRMAMPQSGSFTGWLAASNGACTDSVSFAYTVHGLPQVTIAPSTPRICLGDTLALTVNANATLQWNTSSTLQPTSNGARVWPTANTRYRVHVVSRQGCTNADSVMVQVVPPFSVQVSPDVAICAGASATLTASGETAYQWSPAAGLSQPNSANTIATPTATTRYTLTGSDAFGCFTDTASVLVTVNPLPQLDNIPNKEVNGGESIDVRATANMTIAQWTWTPATYLSCANCPNPTIRPLNDVVYTVTANSAAGCKASVSFEVKVLCSKERIYIPNAFTPNGDGLNDRFKLLGGGVTTVRYLRITDRWGNTIFERKMVPFGSIEASWDGNYPNGSAAPSGNYQFMAELECASGETFRFDGGVRLLR